MQNRLRAEVIYAKYVHTASKGDAKVAFVPMPSGHKKMVLRESLLPSDGSRPLD